MAVCQNGRNGQIDLYDDASQQNCCILTVQYFYTKPLIEVVPNCKRLSNLGRLLSDWFWCLIFRIIPYFSYTCIVLLLELFYTSVHIQWTQCRLLNEINHLCYLAPYQIWQPIKWIRKTSIEFWVQQDPERVCYVLKSRVSLFVRK